MRITLDFFFLSPHVIKGGKPQKHHEEDHPPLGQGRDGGDGSGIDDRGVFPQSRAADRRVRGRDRERKRTGRSRCARDNPAGRV
ncbi:MAG: hypothetical protein PF495_15575 [Spirochaetales bacterium]|nr:hypothetical protein [Spirochaetales bacterium]